VRYRLDKKSLLLRAAEKLEACVALRSCSGRLVLDAPRATGEGGWGAGVEVGGGAGGGGRMGGGGWGGGGGGEGGGTVEETKVKELVDSNPITQEDLAMAVGVTNKSSGGGLEGKYEAWAKAYGST